MSEIMRLMKLAREADVTSLLDEALNGREKTVENVTKLLGFIVRKFGQDGSDVTEKFWKVIQPYLAEAGVAEKEMHKIRRPFLVFGEKGFRSILDEMREERPDLFD